MPVRDPMRLATRGKWSLFHCRKYVFAAVNKLFAFLKKKKASRNRPCGDTLNSNYNMSHGRGVNKKLGEQTRSVRQDFKVDVSWILAREVCGWKGTRLVL